MAANPANKERRVLSGDKPYMVWQSGNWTWNVLKSWQGDNSKPGARWFCQVITPMTNDSGDLGDTYVYSIIVEGRAELTDWDRDIWPDRYAVQEFVGEPKAIPGFM